MDGSNPSGSGFQVGIRRQDANGRPNRAHFLNLM
jgi:hypothetical protein